MKAKLLGDQCHIVVRDWLEDCLIGDFKKKRFKPEKEYTLNHVLKRINDGLKKKADCRLKFEEGVQASYELVDNRTYHGLQFIAMIN